MRKTILFLVLAVVAMMTLSLIGFGQTFDIHGGTPTDVVMSTYPDVCNGENPVGTERVSLLPTQVHVGQDSDLLAYFVSTWSGFGRETELVITLQAYGDGFNETSPGWIAHGGTRLSIHDTGTVMWTFPDVPEGDYTVEATAQVSAFPGALHGGDTAALQSCALSVFVMPALP